MKKIFPLISIFLVIILGYFLYLNLQREEISSQPMGEITTGGIIQNEWPMFRYDLKRTGYLPSKTSIKIKNYSEIWAYAGSTPPEIGCWGLIDENESDISFDTSPAIGDLNGDGKLEVVIGFKDMVHYGDGTENWADLIRVFSLEGKGNNEAEIVWDYEVRGLIRSSPTLTDLNQDGNLEIVVGSDDHNIYALTHDGKLLWTYETEGIVRSSPALADINQDGNLEIVIGSDDHNIYALTHDGKLLWTYETQGIVRSSPALTDLNQDGNLEIVVGSDDHNIYALTHDGKLLWSYATGGIVRSSPAIANINGDENLEIVVGSDDHNIYALTHDGKLLWTYETEGIVRSSPALADINNDGHLEIVIGSADGNVYFLTSEGALSNFKIYGCCSLPKKGLYETKEPFYSTPAISSIVSDNETFHLVVISSKENKLYLSTSRYLMVIREIYYGIDTILTSSVGTISNEREILYTVETINGKDWVVSSSSYLLIDGNNLKLGVLPCNVDPLPSFDFTLKQINSGDFYRNMKFSMKYQGGNVKLKITNEADTNIQIFGITGIIDSEIMPLTENKNLTWLYRCIFDMVDCSSRAYHESTTHYIKRNETKEIEIPIKEEPSAMVFGVMRDLIFTDCSTEECTKFDEDFFKGKESCLKNLWFIKIKRPESGWENG